MATSKVNRDSDEIVSEIHIAAQPDRVFQALVDPEQVVKWWGQGGVYRCTQFDADHVCCCTRGSQAGRVK